MAQFEVHRNLAKPPAVEVSYLLAVQSDDLEIFDSTVVPRSRIRAPIRRLNPGLRIEGVAVVMATQLIAGASIRNLGAVVATLADRRDEIVGAIDLLITGA